MNQNAGPPTPIAVTVEVQNPLPMDDRSADDNIAALDPHATASVARKSANINSHASGDGALHREWEAHSHAYDP